MSINEWAVAQAIKGALKYLEKNGPIKIKNLVKDDPEVSVLIWVTRTKEDK